MEYRQSGSHLSLWYPEFLLGLHHALPVWLLVASPSPEFVLRSLVSCYCQGWNWYGMSQSLHHKSYCWLFSAQRPQTNKVFVIGRTFQRPGDHLPVAEGRDQTSFLAMIKFVTHFMAQSFKNLCSKKYVLD